MTWITFLSDYGHGDGFVGICHGVIARGCPDARVLDVAHDVPRHDVRAGALALADALPFLPVGVHLAIVDPEVGAERRAVALRLADERLLVGPDNGVLALAATAAGGVMEAVEITRSRHRLEPVSATFHGRDVFAPAAAALAGGAPLGAAGDPLDTEELVELELPRPAWDGDVLVAHALTADAFGNVRLDATHADLAGSPLRLGRPVEVEVTGASRRAQFARTFADVSAGELLLYEDAQRSLALAVNRGDARQALGLERDGEVRVRAA